MLGSPPFQFSAAAAIASGVIAYWGTSAILLKWPHLIHRRNPYPSLFAFAEEFRPDGSGSQVEGAGKGLQKLVGVVGHRGAMAEAPENTLAGFAHAIAAGADLLQVDVCLTRDGEVVVSHQSSSNKEDLGSLTGVKKAVGEFDYKDLPPFLPTIPARGFCEPTEISTAKFGPTGNRIMLLEDILKGLGPTPMYIELWDDKLELVQKTWNIVKRCGHERTVLLGHPFSSSIQKKCLSVAPDCPTMMGTLDILRTYTLYYTGLLPFLPLPNNRVLNILFVTPNAQKLLDRINPMMSWNAPLDSFEFGVKLFANFGSLFKAPPLFKHLRKRGVPVTLFILNSPSEWEQGLQAGVDGLMTDYPTRLAAYLQQRSKAAAS